MDRKRVYNQTISTIDTHPNSAFIAHVAMNPLSADRFQHSTFLDEEHTGTDYERYFTVLDVKDEVEAEMETDFTERTVNSFYRHARSQKHAFADFYNILRDFKQRVLEQQFLQDSFALQSRAEFMDKLIFEDMKVYFENMPGCSPKSWPTKLDDFLAEVFKVPVTGFFHQPFKIHQQYYREFKKVLEEHLLLFKERKATDVDTAVLGKMLTADLVVNFLRGSFKRLVKFHNRLSEVSRLLTEEQNEAVTITLSKTMAVLFKSLLLAVRKTMIDFKGYKNRCERIFVIPNFKIYDFNTQEGYCCTTDGMFLYEVTASANMIHLTKIGTGRGGTQPGIVYREELIGLPGQKHLSIVWLKNKLYLKHLSDGSGMVDVYSPDNLEKTGSVTLNVQKYMKNPHLAQYNKFFKLFTDGNSLYSLMLGHTTVKIERPPKNGKDAAKDTSKETKNATGKEKEEAKTETKPTPAKETSNAPSKVNPNANIKDELQKLIPPEIANKIFENQSVLKTIATVKEELKKMSEKATNLSEDPAPSKKETEEKHPEKVASLAQTEVKPPAEGDQPLDSDRTSEPSEPSLAKDEIDEKATPKNAPVVPQERQTASFFLSRPPPPVISATGNLLLPTNQTPTLFSPGTQPRTPPATDTVEGMQSKIKSIEEKIENVNKQKANILKMINQAQGLEDSLQSLDNRREGAPRERFDDRMFYVPPSPQLKREETTGLRTLNLPQGFPASRLPPGNSFRIQNDKDDRKKSIERWENSNVNDESPFRFEKLIRDPEARLSRQAIRPGAGTIFTPGLLQARSSEARERMLQLLESEQECLQNQRRLIREIERLPERGENRDSEKTNFNRRRNNNDSYIFRYGTDFADFGIEQPDSIFFNPCDYELCVDEAYPDMYLETTDSLASEAFAQLEMFKRSQELYKSKVRKINPDTKAPQKTAQSQQTEGEKNLIEFYVVQFNVDVCEPKEDESKSTNDPNINELTQELYNKFSGFFDMNVCRAAIVKSGAQIQDAGKLLLKEGSKKEEIPSFAPVNEVLIYQTECQGYDFKQIKTVKLFNVVNKSLLTPNDIYNGTFYVKNGLLLKNNGLLFSLNSADEVRVEPAETEVVEVFNPVNRFLKTEGFKFMAFTPSTENIDVIPKAPASMSNSLVLGQPAVGDAAKKPDYVLKIRTTFITNHGNLPLFTHQTNVALFYDSQNSLFYTVQFDPLPNANYNFMRQRFSYYYDNSCEGSHLSRMINSPEPLEIEAISVLSFLGRTKNLQQFGQLFLTCLLSVNKARPHMPKRLNDWVYLLNMEAKASATEKGKKSKSNFNAKIKKVAELTKSRLNKKYNIELVNPTDKKSASFRELNYVHFLCVKGNFKTAKILLKMILNSESLPSAKQHAIAFLKICLQYFEVVSPLEDITNFAEHLIQELREKRVESADVLSVIAQFGLLFTYHMPTFELFFNYCLKENKTLFNFVLSELFGECQSIQNKFINRLFIVLTCNDDFDVNEQEEQAMQISLTQKMNTTFALTFHNGREFKPLFNELVSAFKTTNSAHEKQLILNAIGQIINCCCGHFPNVPKTDLNGAKDKDSVHTDKKEKKKARSQLKSSIEERKDEHSSAEGKEQKSNQSPERQELITQGYDRFKETALLFLSDFLSVVENDPAIDQKPDSDAAKLTRQLESQFAFLATSFRPKDLNLYSTIINRLMKLVDTKFAKRKEEYNLSDRELKSLKKRMHNEGLCQSEVHVLETIHPVERGKAVTFKRIHDERALGFLVEFDRRCQDEETSDSLLFSSWFDSEKKGTLNNSGTGNVNKYLNVNSRNMPNKQAVMIGDNLDVQFISSNVAKNNGKSLSQWGYKLYIKPILRQGLEQLAESVLGDRYNNSEIVENFVADVAIIRNALFASRLLIEGLIRGTSMTASEQSYAQYLNWSILQKGMANIDSDNFLAKTETQEYALQSTFKDRQKSLMFIGGDSERNSVSSKTNNDRLSFVTEDGEVQELLRTSKDSSSEIAALIQHVRSLDPVPFAYQSEKRRAPFEKKYQEEWNELETLIILCYLHHAHILELLRSERPVHFDILSMQPNIKAELSEISKKRYEVISFLLSECKVEENYQSAANELFDWLKTEYTRKYISTKIEAKRKELESKEQKKDTVEKIDKKELLRRKCLEAQNKKRQGKGGSGKQIQPKTGQSSGLQTPLPEPKQPEFDYFVLSEVDVLLKDQTWLERAREIIKETFETKTETLRRLFQRREIEFTKEAKENFRIVLDLIIKDIRSHITKNTQDDKAEMSFQLESPYKTIGNMLRERLVFLMRINANVGDRPNAKNELRMIELKRERSIPETTPKDKSQAEVVFQPWANRAYTSEPPKSRPQGDSNSIREWVENYKSWKGQAGSREEDLVSPDCSPVYAVTKFLTEQKPIKMAVFQSIVSSASKRISVRIIGFQHFKKFMALIDNTVFELFALPFLTALFSSLSVFESVQTTGQSFKSILADLSLEVARPLILRFLDSLELIRTVDCHTLYETKKLIGITTASGDLSFFDEAQSNLDQSFYLLVEIYTLLNNNITLQALKTAVYNNSLAKDKKLKIFLQLIPAIIEYLLLGSSLKNISYDFKCISVAIKRNIRLGALFLNMLIKTLSNSFTLIDIFGALLRLELGENQGVNQISTNVLNRINDPIGEQRYLFLLKNLFKAIRKFKDSDKRITKENELSAKRLAESLLLIVLYCQHSRIVKLSLSCLDLLDADFGVLRNFAKEDIYKQMTFVHTVCSPIGKKEFVARIAAFGGKDNHFAKISHDEKVTLPNQITSVPSTNLMNILCKMGDLVLPPANHRGDPRGAGELYNVYLHMVNEEDLCPLVRAFYYWEQLYPTFSKSLPKTYDEYLEHHRRLNNKNESADSTAKRNIKNIDNSLQFHQQMSPKMRLTENLIQELPDFNFLKGDLPFGWYLNANRVFPDMKIKPEGMFTVYQKTSRKLWENKNLNKLMYVLVDCLKGMKPPVFLSDDGSKPEPELKIERESSEMSLGLGFMIEDGGLDELGKRASVAQASSNDSKGKDESDEKSPDKVAVATKPKEAVEQPKPAEEPQQPAVVQEQSAQQNAQPPQPQAQPEQPPVQAQGQPAPPIPSPPQPADNAPVEPSPAQPPADTKPQSPSAFKFSREDEILIDKLVSSQIAMEKLIILQKEEISQAEPTPLMKLLEKQKEEVDTKTKNPPKSETDTSPDRIPVSNRQPRKPEDPADSDDKDNSDPPNSQPVSQPSQPPGYRQPGLLLPQQLFITKIAELGDIIQICTIDLERRIKTACPNLSENERKQILSQRIQTVRATQSSRETTRADSKVIQSSQGKVYKNLPPEQQEKVRDDFVQSYRLIFTLIEICKHIQTIATYLNYTGYSNVFQNSHVYQDRLEKAEELAYLINLLQHKKMREVSLKCINDESVLKKLATVMKLVNDNNFSLDLSVSLVNASLIPKMNKFFKYSARLKVPPEDYVKFANKYMVVSEHSTTAKSRSLVLNMLSEFVNGLAAKDKKTKEQLARLFCRFLDGEQLSMDSSQDDRIKVGLVVLTKEWTGELSASQNVASLIGDQQFKIIAPTSVTGRSQILAINEAEPRGLIKLESDRSLVFSNVGFNAAILDFDHKKIVSRLLELLKIHSNFQVESLTASYSGLGPSLAQQIQTVFLFHLFLKLSEDDKSMMVPELQSMLRVENVGILDNLELVSKEFCVAVERACDSYIPMPILAFEQFRIKEQRYPFEIDRRKVSVKIEETLNTRLTDTPANSYFPPKSTFLGDLDVKTERVSEFRMLKHWEKHVMPKILNFVKNNLNQYEIDDYCEQIRIELRKNNNPGASNIVYVICEQKLPGDLILPPISYDWNCIDIDELKVGQWVTFKIKDDRFLHAHVLDRYQNLGVNTVVGTVAFKDPVNSCVNVLVRDYYQNNLYSIWVPQQSIKAIEAPVKAPPQFYPTNDLIDATYKSFGRLIKSLKTEYYLKELVKKDSQLVSETDFAMLKLIANRELKGDCLFQWLRVSDSSASNSNSNVLETVLSKLAEQGLCEQILDQAAKELTELVAFFTRNNYSFNMTSKLDVNVNTKERAAGLNRHANLNIFDCPNDIAGFIVEFKTNSNLYKCSGVKFFDDPEGINMIEHIHATQRADLKTLYPLVFNRSDVYYQFYYNAEALPAYMKADSTTKLDCSVFAVPTTLNYTFWVIDAITLYSVKGRNTKLLAKAYEIAASLLANFKGSNVAKQAIFKLLTRVIIRVRIALKSGAEGEAWQDRELLAEAVLGHSPVDVEQLVKLLEFFIEKVQSELYSSYVQDLTEFLVLYTSVVSLIDPKLLKQPSKTALQPIQNKAIKDIKDMFALADFLAKGSAAESGNDDKTKSEVWEILKGKLNALNYFDHLIFVSGIPAILHDTLERLVNEVVKKEGMKVLVPAIDIYIPRDHQDNSVGYMLILYDSWEFREEPADKEGGADEAKEEEETPAPRMWRCDVCTLLNDDSADTCGACDSAKPSSPYYPDDDKPEEPKKPKEDEEAQVYWSNKVRADRFKNELLKAFERITPDKRITVRRFESSNLAEIENSIEVAEFFTNRMISEQLQERMDETSRLIFKSHETAVKQTLSANSAEELKDSLLEMEPVKFFVTLATFGVDFWLEKSCIDHFGVEPLQMVASKDIQTLIDFMSKELCEDAPFSIYFSGIDFRVEFKTPVCNLDPHKPGAPESMTFKESKLFFFKYMRMNLYTNFQLRLTLTAVHAFNQILLKQYRLLDLTNVKSVAVTDSAQSSRQQTVKPTSDPAMSQRQTNGNCSVHPSSEYLSLGSLISNIRHLWLSSVKNQMCEEVLQLTASARDHTPKVFIERLTKEKEIITEKKPDSRRQTKKEQEDRGFTFIQAFRQITEISPTLLRPHKPKGAEPFISFEIVFKGEHVMGEGGPYRQFFSDVSAELQPMFTNLYDSSVSKNLNLFIPSPNRVNDIGDAREKFVVNPSKKSSYYLQLFEFIGVLMGCAFRTKVFLSLNLPRMFWKKLVGLPIEEEDLEEIDKGIIELVRYFRTATEEDLEENIFQNFTVLLSDTSVYELIPNGKDVKVNAQNKDLYVKLVLEARCAENDAQIAAIRAGFTKVVPAVLFNCLTPADLEVRVCGQTAIDFSLLKKHTRYSGKLTEDSPLIQNFWKALHSFSNADKQRFIKFCWGQERLPSTAQEFENAHIRFMVKPSLYSGPQDGLLPRADTCFFNFELPNYSTLEIMKEKILLAIHTDSDSMNAEEQGSEHQNQGEDKSWVSHSQDSQQFDDFMD